MIGELYEHALAGRARPEVEHADGSRKPLPVDGWLRESPGDKSILDPSASAIPLLREVCAELSMMKTTA